MEDLDKPQEWDCEGCGRHVCLWGATDHQFLRLCSRCHALNLLPITAAEIVDLTHFAPPEC